MQSSFSDPSENGQRALGVMGALDPPATIHLHFSASFLNLCRIVLLSWIVSRNKTKDVFHRKVLPYIHIAPSPATFCFFSQCVITNSPWLLATILVFYYQQSLVGSSASHYWCLRHTHEPLSSGVLQRVAQAEISHVNV